MEYPRPAVSFEVFPSKKLNSAMLANLETDALTITCTAQSLAPTFSFYQALGCTATPHIPARRIKDEADAEHYAGIVSKRVFLIAGDRAPRGPFSRAIELFPYFKHCTIGVAAYPEGHPDYPFPEWGDEILLEKQENGARYAVTQMCFNADTINHFVERVRSKGVTLPIYCGVAVPISRVRLAAFALKCGVGPSMKILHRSSSSSLVALLGGKRYKPYQLIENVRENVDGFHFYTFNEINSAYKMKKKLAHYGIQ